MAALKEEQCYGLSCGRVSKGSNVSVFHVKLTDSALRAFEAYRSTKVSAVCPRRDVFIFNFSEFVFKVLTQAATTTAAAAGGGAAASSSTLRYNSQSACVGLASLSC